MITCFGKLALLAYSFHPCKPNQIPANSVDPDETARNCFIWNYTVCHSVFGLCADNPTYNNGHAKIQRRKNPTQKLRVEMVNPVFG